jgi:hypothetical protein
MVVQDMSRLVTHVFLSKDQEQGVTVQSELFYGEFILKSGISKEV